MIINIDDKKLAEYKRARAAERECSESFQRCIDAKEPSARRRAISDAWDRATEARRSAYHELREAFELELDKP